MDSIIKIVSENRNKGNWIKVTLPRTWKEPSFVTIKNSQGDILKKLELEEGNNAIDISQLLTESVSILVETPYETILKQIKINQ